MLRSVVLMELNLVLIMNIIWVLMMSSLMVQIMFKHVVSITDEQLEYNDGTSLDIYESFGDVNDDVRKVIG